MGLHSTAGFLIHLEVEASCELDTAHHTKWIFRKGTLTHLTEHTLFEVLAAAKGIEDVVIGEIDSQGVESEIPAPEIDFHRQSVIEGDFKLPMTGAGVQAPALQGGDGGV